MAMQLLNVAPSANLFSAVNFSQLNNLNTFNSHVNLISHIINNQLSGRLATNRITEEHVQKLIGQK